MLAFVIVADYNSANLALDGDQLAQRFAPRDRQMDLFTPEPSVITGQL